MTDYFALLEQRPAPWIDPAALKEIYHRKTLRTHPDTAGADPQADFAEVNEAYQVLQDPKRRLHHLLTLENSAPPAGNHPVPEQLQDLFLLIGDLHQRAKLILEKRSSSSNALSRSLLQPQIVALQKEVDGLHTQVADLIAASEQRLREMNSNWDNDRAGQMPALADLYSRFAYLTRWSAQLDELSFQLSQ